MVSDIILLSYLAVTAMVGMYFTKKNKNIAEFFVAKRGLGTLLIISVVFPEIIGGNAAVGVSEGAFEIGISSVWLIWAMRAGCFIFAIFVSKFYYNMIRS